VGEERAGRGMRSSGDATQSQCEHSHKCDACRNHAYARGTQGRALVCLAKRGLHKCDVHECDMHNFMPTPAHTHILQSFIVERGRKGVHKCDTHQIHANARHTNCSSSVGRGQGGEGGEK